MFYNDFEEFTILMLQTAEKRSQIPGDHDGRTYAINGLFIPVHTAATQLSSVEIRRGHVEGPLRRTIRRA